MSITLPQNKTKQRQVVCLYIVGLSYVVSDVDLIQVPILL